MKKLLPLLLLPFLLTHCDEDPLDPSQDKHRINYTVETDLDSVQVVFNRPDALMDTVWISTPGLKFFAGVYNRGSAVEMDAFSPDSGFVRCQIRSSGDKLFETFERGTIADGTNLVFVFDLP